MSDKPKRRISSAPPPINALEGSSRSWETNYRFGEPHWDKWQKLDTAFLWEAACLAADINPPSADIWYEAQLRGFPERFHEVWEILNRDEQMSRFPLVNISGRMLIPVLLDDFADWAIAKGLLLPSQLSKRATRPAKIEASTSGEAGAAALATPSVGVRKHELKFRMNVLDVAIDRAILKAGSDRVGIVFAELREMALEQIIPFTGSIESDALMYTDGGAVKAFDKNMLGARLTRRRKRMSV